MANKATGRMELRVPPGRKATWTRAAARAGLTLSDWARRRLDELAEEELAHDDAAPPSPEDLRIALSAYGALGREGAAQLRARVLEARRTPWHGKS
jgi:uncharacterized protein (DUF1778 family)